MGFNLSEHSYKNSHTKFHNYTLGIPLTMPTYKIQFLITSMVMQTETDMFYHILTSCNQCVYYYKYFNIQGYSYNNTPSMKEIHGT